MRQNCLPHMVNRPISVRMTMVDTAAIAQALAIHTSDFHSSLPQSNVGVNISMRARYLGGLRPAFQEASTPGRERVEPDSVEVPIADQLNAGGGRVAMQPGQQRARPGAAVGAVHGGGVLVLLLEQHT